MIKENLACDYCTKILVGTEGTAIIQKDYISVFARFSYSFYSEEFKKYLHAYLSKQNQQLVFCDVKCMTDYTTMQINLKKNSAINFARGVKEDDESEYVIPNKY